MGDIRTDSYSVDTKQSCLLASLGFRIQQFTRDCGNDTCSALFVYIRCDCCEMTIILVLYYTNIPRLCPRQSCKVKL